MLEAVNVTKRHAATVALAGVSVRVGPGESVALVGESGSGKTTLLRTFNRMVEPDSGTVRVRGQDVAAADPIQLRRSIGQQRPKKMGFQRTVPATCPASPP